MGGREVSPTRRAPASPFPNSYTLRQLPTLPQPLLSLCPHTRRDNKNRKKNSIRTQCHQKSIFQASPSPSPAAPCHSWVQESTPGMVKSERVSSARPRRKDLFVSSLAGMYSLRKFMRAPMGFPPSLSPSSDSCHQTHPTSAAVRWIHSPWFHHSTVSAAGDLVDHHRGRRSFARWGGLYRRHSRARRARDRER